MSEIIPSTKLKMVSTHKLLDLVCPRQYFWRRVLNLESIYLNINFWWGGVLGAGFEARLMGRDWRAAMRKEDRKRCEGKVIGSELAKEMKAVRSIIEIQLKCVKCQPVFKRLKMVKDQCRFKVPLKCGIMFCGTKDGEGTHDGEEAMFEIKTASRVTAPYIAALRYGRQINGYAWGDIRKGRKNRAKICVACIFRKPGLIVKKDQSLEEFMEEIEVDIMGGIDYRGRKRKARPKMYYRFQTFTLGYTTVMDVGYDIEQDAADLKEKYDRARNERQLLNPHYWPKRENKCHDYSGCEFQQLCLHPKSWNVHLDQYQQREMLYPIEKKELKGE